MESAFGPRVHHRADVVHPRLEVGHGLLPRPARARRL